MEVAGLMFEALGLKTPGFLARAAERTALQRGTKETQAAVPSA
jgi:hypothetical protein